MKLYGNSRRAHEEAERKDRRPRRGLRALVIVLACLLLLVLAGMALKSALTKPPVQDIHGLGQSSTTTSSEPVTDIHGNTVTKPTSDDPTQPQRTFTRKSHVYTFLIVGVDKGRANTDTIMVGALDTREKTLNMVSIPRDTMVNVPWHTKKINSVYANRGMDGLIAELRKLLGFNVDCYVEIDLNGFVQLVDAIGGVDFDVPEDMNYDDPVQGLSIHFKKGFQHLDGASALKVARYRGYASADIGRISTQQKLLKAIAKRCLSLFGVTKIGNFIDIFNKNVQTDLSTQNILWFAQELLKLNSENMVFATLPAKYDDSVYGQSYVTVYLDRWLEMLNQRLDPYEEPILPEDLAILTRDSDGQLYVTDGSSIEGSFK